MSVSIPTFHYERALLDAGYKAVVGVDEAGTGALAGPIFAGAVILSPNCRLPELHDSKLKTKLARDRLYNLICTRARVWAVGEASVAEIYDLGLRQANYLAMKRAIEQIPQADFALVDAWTIPNLPIRQQGIVKGDQKVRSIAAASILAKVSRDRVMEALANQYPDYGFEVHKGYGTRLHRTQISALGPCKIHRLRYKTFLA